MYFHNILFLNWSYSVVNYKQPVVAFPEECLVDKFAPTVIYYVVCWILHVMSWAMTIAKKDRQMYLDFVGYHCLDVVGIKTTGLSTSLVDMKKKGIAKYIVLNSTRGSCHRLCIDLVTSCSLYDSTPQCMSVHCHVIECLSFHHINRVRIEQ